MMHLDTLNLYFKCHFLFIKDLKKKNIMVKIINDAENSALLSQEYIIF